MKMRLFTLLINFKFEKGKFYGISGKVGSGKSSLFGAILQEIPFYTGSLDINGSIAYIEQEPVIFSGSIRSNILFGKEYEEKNGARNNVYRIFTVCPSLLFS